MYFKIIIVFVSIVRELCGIYFLFYSAIMFFQNAGIVTIATTELIPHKIYNPYLLYFQKIYTITVLSWDIGQWREKGKKG